MMYKNISVMKRKIFVWAQIVVAAALFGLVTANVLERLPKEEERAKYIFLMIGDGMGAANVGVTESYLSYKAGKLGGEQLMFTTFPYYGTATTHSANKNVTCSAAAATAIARGIKINNYMLGMQADSTTAPTVSQLLHDEGYQVGIMSTVPANHATPAGFYAIAGNREDYYNITKQIPASGYEFIGGAGLYQFNGADNNSQPSDEYLEENGYEVCFGVKEFNEKKSSSDKIVYLHESAKNSKPAYYESGETIKEEDVKLGEMLSLCLDFFNEDEPFFIMCEGGHIDWSSHSNKTMPMVNDVLEFDGAIKVAYDFYLQHPDETLIIVTADHETGGISLGCGNSSINWEMIENEWNSAGQKHNLDKEENNALNKAASIGWTTTSHNGSPVPVYAIGKGAEKFMGRMDNTDIKGKILNK